MLLVICEKVEWQKNKLKEINRYGYVHTLSGRIKIRLYLNHCLDSPIHKGNVSTTASTIRKKLTVDDRRSFLLATIADRIFPVGISNKLRHDPLLGFLGVEGRGHKRYENFNLLHTVGTFKHKMTVVNVVIAVEIIIK